MSKRRISRVRQGARGKPTAILEKLKENWTGYIVSGVIGFLILGVSNVPKIIERPCRDIARPRTAVFVRVNDLLEEVNVRSVKVNGISVEVNDLNNLEITG